MEAFPSQPAPNHCNTPAVATYSFNGMDLRVVEIAGEPWFVARDVCLALGMYLSPRDSLPIVTAAVRKLGEGEAHLHPMQVEDKLGRKTTRKIMLVSESGLYKLVMRSDKKEAKQFQDWVTCEVLPSIRKTGTYTMPGALEHKMLWFGELRGE